MREPGPFGTPPEATTIDTTISTVIELAVQEKYSTTYAMLSGALNTLRLLNESMDFFDENGNGWRALTSLCESCIREGGDGEAKIDLLLWMLKLSSSEMRTYPVAYQLAFLLQWVSLKPHPGLDQASKLLFDMGSAELFDAPVHSDGGYNLLQRIVAYAKDFEYLYAVLSQGPDLYRLSVDHLFTPQEESPTSLSMYSSRAFWFWLEGLDSIQVDLEDFVEQELCRNHTVHPGWEKETLLDLFAYSYRDDLDVGWVYTCSDCSGDIRRVRVQPHWRHLIERIKQGPDPDNPGSEEDTDSEGNAEAASSSSDVSLDDLGELPSDSDEEDIHGYPATVSIRSDCIYAQDEVICMYCWRYYRKHGTRYTENGTRTILRNQNLGFVTNTDEYSSEVEYSPFLIHS